MLNSQTTLLVASVMFLVLPVMLWLILPEQDSKATNMWCLGGLMAGTGLVLLGLRPQVPLVVGFHMANTLLMGYFLCAAQSLRISLGHGWTVLGWLARMLLGLLFFSVVFAWTSDALRGALLRFALGCLAVYTAGCAWQLARRMHSLNAAMIAATYLVVGLALMSHSVWVNVSIRDPNPFSKSWDASPLSLIVLFMTLISCLCYLGMALDKAASDKLQAQQAQQAAVQTQLLNTQLSSLDRRGRMAIVSASLSHELNQPLTAALMNAQMAERQWATHPAIGPVLLNLLEQTERAIERTVLILQRIRGQNDLLVQHQDWLDLQTVLDRALEQMSAECQRLAVTLTRERSTRALWCRGDELGFSQVLINLLRNALQSMAECPHRHLWVSCSEQQGQVRLVIRDSGPGMPPELIERWGQAFQSTRLEGMGLGLVISREIVTRHQGQLQLRNHPQGGLEVVLSLPAAGASA